VNQQGLALDRLFVYRIEVNIGEKLARQKFHSKHRAGRMHRPHAHLRITLAERAPRAEKTTRNNNFTIEQQQ
jgi:ribosomal protein L22